MNCLVASKHRLVLLLLFVAVFALATPTHPATHPAMSLAAAEQLFQQANAHYQQQRYSHARNLYSQILDAGIRSPQVFYNMGNACARLGRTGEAVLYYERAKMLAPRYPDISANLRKIAPADNDPQHFVLSRPFFWIVDSFSLREWILAFLVFFYAMGIIGALYFAVPLRGYTPWLRRVFYALAAVSAIFALLGGTKYHQSKHVRYSVVMKPNAPIYSGPGEKFSQLISAPEGTRVRRVDFNDQVWAQVVLMDGQKGFTLAKNLQSI